MDSKEKAHAAEILAYVREQRDQFQIERDNMRQLAFDLAIALREIGPPRSAVAPEIWQKADLAIKQMDRARGIGGYEWPTR